MELDKKWEQMQVKAFKSWANSILAKRGADHMIVNITKDLSTGLLLIALIEELSGHFLGKYIKAPKLDVHKIQNLNMVVTFINKFAEKEKIRVSYDAHSVLNGELKTILGMLWLLIHRYGIEGITEQDKTAKEGLLLWCQNKTKGLRPDLHIEDFHKSWQNGLGFLGLIYQHNHDLVPDFLQRPAKTREERLKNLELAFAIAEKELGIATILDAVDLIDTPRPDEKSIMAQVALYWKRFAANKNTEIAARRVSKWVENEIVTDNMKKEYLNKSQKHRTWLLNKAKSFRQQTNDLSPDLSLTELQDLLAGLVTYRSDERSINGSEKLFIEALLSSILMKLRADNRPSYSPPQDLSPAALTHLWIELDAAEQDYETKLRSALARGKKIDLLLRFFDVKLKKLSAFIADKLPFLENLQTTTASLEQVHAKIYMHEALKEEIRSLEASRFASLVELIGTFGEVGLSQAMIEKKQGLVEDVHRQWAMLVKKHEEVAAALQEELARHRELEKLLLEFSKNAEALEVWAEDTLDLVQQPVSFDSVDDVKSEEKSFQTLIKAMEAKKHELSALEKLALELRAAGVKENAYARFTIEDIKDKWGGLEKASNARATLFKAEEQVQNKHEEMRKEFARQAQALFDKLKPINDALVAEDGQLESLLNGALPLEEVTIEDHPAGMIDLSQYASGDATFQDPNVDDTVMNMRKRLGSLKRGLLMDAHDKLQEYVACKKLLHEQRPLWDAVRALDADMVAAKIVSNKYTKHTVPSLGAQWDGLERLIHDRMANIEKETAAKADALVQNNSSEKEKEKFFTDMFGHFDKAKNGKLELHEFEACLQIVDVELPKDKISELFVKGPMDLKSFLNFMKGKDQDKDTFEQIIEAFKVLASNKNHILHRELVSAKLVDAHIGFLEDRMPQLSGNQDRQFDYPAFVKGVYGLK